MYTAHCAVIFAIAQLSCFSEAHYITVSWCYWFGFNHCLKVFNFLPSQIFWGGHCKNCAHFITPASRDVDWKSPVRILPLARKLLPLTSWILGQILNFHHYFFLGRGGPRPLVVCASKPWWISSASNKFEERQHPRRNVVSRKKSFGV